MEKLFIPYEQALQLKELGFDELCIARFDGGGFRMLPTYDPLKIVKLKKLGFVLLHYINKHSNSLEINMKSMEL